MPTTYDDGYHDGENSAHADWHLAISEAFDGMDDINGPHDFIERINRLLRQRWLDGAKTIKVIATNE